ncbi:Sigma factor AlgU regulatory protein MucB [BD1-7 clade bacterium]|uniref:Sigma factor AlgU regulatory protein MucB n=1 Tax=BD1-7 clade bacterium TaxID=2029982 RepID=A0A5S9P9G9_9GAMM|nr:Sigma factor AlgU regulatory protein MucB [BD1-7 clade bacterium]CAA0115994.1 Sigma factor AlgU regulatory protein MucB [BD1-7 clade bacterium]
MRRLTKALLVIALLPAPLYAQIQDSAQTLIEQMGTRAKSLNYKGYFTFERGSQSTSYFIAHRVDDGEQRQRLFFMDGPEEEVVIDGHGVNCLHPGDKAKRVSSEDVQSLLALSQPKAGIWEHYEAETVGKARIANRITTKVLLKPKDTYRYPFVFFIDNETGLMLKMLILDQQGYPLERFHYVMIEYNDVSAEDVAPVLESARTITHVKKDSVQEKTAEKLWELRWIPEGFHEESAFMKTDHSQAFDEAHMYTDGLSAFSLYVEPVTNALSQQGTSKQLGSTAAVSHYVSVGDQVFLVTVIGEIPVTTARQIAASVKLKP